MKIAKKYEIPENPDREYEVVLEFFKIFLEEYSNVNLEDIKETDDKWEYLNWDMVNAFILEMQTRANVSDDFISRTLETVCEGLIKNDWEYDIVGTLYLDVILARNFKDDEIAWEFLFYLRQYRDGNINKSDLETRVLNNLSGK